MTHPNIDWTALDSFLRAQYATNTARKYLRDIKAYLADPTVATRPDIPQARKRDYVYAWKALEYYVQRTGAPMVPGKGPEMPAALRGGRRTRESQQKRKIKTRFTQREWVALWEGLDIARPTDVVLRLQMQTALRAGDVLRVERAALAEALKNNGAFTFAVKGGKESSMPIALGKADWVVAFNGMKSAGSPNIAGWVSASTDPSGAAYHKTLKRLKQVGEKAGLTRPHTTHRIRRSLATFARENGASDSQVQHLLDHEDGDTTNNYMFGAFATERGQLLGNLHQKLLGKKP